MDKTCNNCGAVKPVELFRKRKFRSGKIGLTGNCRDCLIQKSKDYYNQNKDAFLAKTGAYQKKHRVKANKWNADYRERNRDEILKRSALRRKEKRDVILGYQRKYYDSNRDVCNQRSIDCQHKRRAAEGSYTREEVAELYKKQRGSCPICRHKLDDKFEIDHIVPLSAGGTNWISNIQLTHKSCNRSKSKIDPIAFMQRLGYLI